MESKELLVPNPLLYDNSLKKYIWISDSGEDHRNAQYLFGYLMRRNIYVDGFATNSTSMVDLKMYNKKIINHNSLQHEDSVVFYDIWFKDIWKTYKDRGYRARIINPDMGSENIVIWGSGVTGEKVFGLLEEAGIKVHFFVDSNKKLSGTFKCGLPVCTPDVLEEDNIIIEAMEKWQQLDEEISARYPKRFHFSFNIVWDQITCNLDEGEKKVFSLTDFWPCDRFEGKKLYIYGISGIEIAFANCLKLLDYEFVGFLTDEGTELRNSRYQVMRVEDILYEEDYYVWVYSKEGSQKLKELGLRHYFEYECAVRSYGITHDVKFCLDVNLGHSYLGGSKYPGIEVYGKERKEDYKIAVLGASTSEGVEFSFKSWPQIFYESLPQERITLYNGGVSGYWLGQQLLKLIRDIVPLKPDLLIVYDGYIESYTDVQHPLAFPYAMSVFEHATTYLEKDILSDYEKNVSLGVVSGREIFENWLFCVRSMHAIAKEYNIKFFYFCQPWLSSKKRKTIREKNMLLSASSGSLSYEKRKAFRESVNKKILPEYIYDLSHIFDGEADVYMDSCHVWEKGNRIIAKEIAKVVLPKIEIYKDGKK